MATCPSVEWPCCQMAARNKFLAQDHNNPDTLLFISSRAVDRLSRYEATLWRQACQILFTLLCLDRRKP